MLDEKKKKAAHWALIHLSIFLFYKMEKKKQPDPFVPQTISSVLLSRHGGGGGEGKGTQVASVGGGGGMKN